MPGKPTARRGQLLGEDRMTEKRTPAAEGDRNPGRVGQPPAVGGHGITGRIRTLGVLPSRDRQPAGPLEARPPLQAGARPRRRPPDHVSRAAPYVRHAHGRRRHADAHPSALDGPHRLEDDADLRPLSAERPGGRRRRSGVRVTERPIFAETTMPDATRIVLFTDPGTSTSSIHARVTASWRRTSTRCSPPPSRRSRRGSSWPVLRGQGRDDAEPRRQEPAARQPYRRAVTRARSMRAR